MEKGFVNVACGVNLYPKTENMAKLNFVKILRKSCQASQETWTRHGTYSSNFSVQRILQIENEHQIPQEQFHDKRKTHYPFPRWRAQIGLGYCRKMCGNYLPEQSAAKNKTVSSLHFFNLEMIFFSLSFCYKIILCCPQRTTPEFHHLCC